MKSLFRPLEAWCFGYLARMGLIAFCNDAPDTSGVNAAAVANANISKEALDWYKQAYADQAPAREAAAARANAVSDAQLQAMNTQTRIANEADQYNRDTFRPLEQGLVRDAQNFDTEQERERLAGLALGDVHQSFDAARDIAERDLTRKGVNPNDGAYGASAVKMGNAEALAGADAMNKSRMGSIALSRAMKYDAAALGRGLAGNQTAAAQAALAAGNSSAQNAQTPVQIAQNATNQVGTGFNTAISGNNSSGNLYGQAAQIQNQASANDNAIFGALGQVGGAAMFKYSDKKMKKNIKPVKGEVALAAARKIPVSRWQYKEGTPASDGGREHVGPMAQDVRAALGNAVAPGGKMIDTDSVNAMTLAAVKALDKKVTKLQKQR